MTKSIHTLIPDIYNLLGGPDGITNLEPNVGDRIQSALEASFRNSSERRGLRLSGLGPKCPRALWYSVHHPELAEPVPPYARIKFAYGHVIEHLVIGLAKAAGHEVTGEQDEIICDGILGHRDCVIDGVIVDVKSAATRSFQKFKDKTIATNDSFGYLDQLDGYLLGSIDDPLVRVKDKAYLLAVDKQLGHLALYEHRLRHDSIRERIRLYKEIAGRLEAPACRCGTETNDASGNIILDVPASYSPFKFCCHPELRVFKYSDGPKFFVRVNKHPVNKNGPLMELTTAFKQGIIYE